MDPEWRWHLYERLAIRMAEAEEQRNEALGWEEHCAEAADCYSEQADDAERIGGILRRAGHARQEAEEAVARTLRWRPGEPVMPRRTAFRVGKGGGEPVTPARAVTDVGPVRRKAAEMPGNSEPVALAWRSQQPACDRGPQGPEPVFRSSPWAGGHASALPSHMSVVMAIRLV